MNVYEEMKGYNVEGYVRAERYMTMSGRFLK